MDVAPAIFDFQTPNFDYRTKSLEFRSILFFSSVTFLNPKSKIENLKSPDHPLRSREHLRRNGDAKFFGGLEVDREIGVIDGLDPEVLG